MNCYLYVPVATFGTNGSVSRVVYIKEVDFDSLPSADYAGSPDRVAIVTGGVNTQMATDIALQVMERRWTEDSTVIIRLSWIVVDRPASSSESFGDALAWNTAQRGQLQSVFDYNRGWNRQSI
ncbi:MAG: hypothetical protein M0000_05745 [Actinomycetota bacterium]|nr:hypothetical protein [Actinomycetota bacterium]